jgi:hypothetical protein
VPKIYGPLPSKKTDEWDVPTHKSSRETESFTSL